MLPLIGLLAGIILGLILEPSLPAFVQPYLPIAIVAAMDALFGGFRAYLEGNFSDKVFAISFVSNVLIAAAIVYMGDLIGVGAQLSTAVVVVLGIRIFTNAAAIRRSCSMPDSIQPDPAPNSRPRRDLQRVLFRPGRGQVIAAVILFVVGLGLVTQLRIQSAENVYSGSRREDLIQMLDGLGAESRRLESEIAELEQTRADLQSGADRQSVARTETERRLAVLAILAGTAPASGPGIRLDHHRSGRQGDRRGDPRRRRGAAGRRRRSDRDQRHVESRGLDLVRQLRRRLGRRRPDGHPSDHRGGDRGPAQPGGGRLVPGRTGQRDHRSPDRRPGRDRASLAAPRSTPCTARRRISTLGQHRLRPPHVDLEFRSRKCPNFPRI